MTTVQPQQQPSFPPLVVSTDPVASNRATRGAYGLAVGLTIGSVVVAIVLAALAGSVLGIGLGILSVVPFGIAFAFALFLSLRLATMRGVQSIARTALVVDGFGLHTSIPQGELDLPWAAVEGVSIRPRGRHRVITFHLPAGLTPTSPGVQTSLSPQIFGVLVKRGFQIGSAGVSTPPETILDATRAFTGGRLVAR